MVDTKAKKPVKLKRRISGTTYIVTSHFRTQGGTATDKIRHLIDTKAGETHRIKADFLT